MDCWKDKKSSRFKKSGEKNIWVARLDLNSVYSTYEQRNVHSINRNIIC